MTTYQIIEATPDSKVGYQPFGAAVDLWKCQAPEVMISGPAETGKTRACLEKMNVIAWKYPGAHILLCRKTRQSMGASVLKTFQDQVLGPNTPVTAYGGHNPQWFDYPNGTRIVVAGLDKAAKVLSSEFDMILPNQAEELTRNDWEMLTTRVTGRAGNMPYPQLLGDCNPGPSTHWIRQRAGLVLLESRHEDNPILFDQATGQMTAQGERTMSVLDKLTGVRKARLRFGRWASAEGAVYDEFDEAVHLIDRFDIPDDWRRFRAVDFGYTNPFVCQWWAMDPDDRLYLYREIYMSQRLVEDHADDIKRLTAGVDRGLWDELDDGQKREAVTQGERIELTVADHDAEDRATLRQHGVPTIAADKRVSVGIQAVQARLKKAGDGKPRIFFMRDSLVEEDPMLRAAHKPTHTAAEFPDYVWAKSADGRPVKEEPIKVNDHGADDTRYITMNFDAGKSKLKLTWL